MVDNDWNEYRNLILHELHESNEKLSKLSDLVVELKADMSALKVKAAVAGGIAGMVGTGVVTAILTAFK